MSPDTPDTNPTQLVRYVLYIDSMTEEASIMRVRQQLTGIGLLVDQITSGHAEVAVVQQPNPGPDGIRTALREAGFELRDYETQIG